MSYTRWKDASYNLGKRYVYKDCRIFTMFDYNFSCSVFVQTPSCIQSGDVARFPVHPCLPVLLRPLVVANMLIYPRCSLALWTAHSADFLVHHWLLLFHLLCWSSPFAQQSAECRVSQDTGSQASSSLSAHSLRSPPPIPSADNTPNLWS